jgi:soluble cytochrome b562
MHTTRSVTAALALTLTGILSACTAKEPAAPPAPAAPPLEALATTKQLMLGITIPASDVVFQVGNKAPADDMEWEKVQASALAVAESGNLLLVGTRVVDHGDWEKNARALILVAKEAAQAAEQKNVEQVLAAGDKLYEVCDTCHKKYMAARGGV